MEANQEQSPDTAVQQVEVAVKDVSLEHKETEPSEILSNKENGTDVSVEDMKTEQSYMENGAIGNVSVEDKKKEPSDLPSDVENRTIGSDSVEAEEDHFESLWCLETLPVEIFLHICSFLDAKFLACTMRFVCRHFYAVLSDEAMWKTRIGRRWNHVYPPLPVEGKEFSWMKACSRIEEEYKRWSKMSETTHCVTLRDAHVACVDAILLLNSGSLLVSGSRDHNLIVWSVESDRGDVVPQVTVNDAHKGWIWNLAVQHDIVISCSWDATVKTWQLGEGAVQEISEFTCKHPVLSLACDDSLIAAGLFSRGVNLYDSRSGTKFISSYCAHKGPVLALAMTGNFIVSASEDKTLSIWDHRAGKIFKQMITFGNSVVKGRWNIPLCLSLDDRLLYVGDGEGQVHLLDPSQGSFDVVKNYDVGHSGRLTGIQHSLGCLITCSTDKTLRVLTPTLEPELIQVIHTQGGEVTRFDYKNNVLAAGGDRTVSVWMPKADE